MLRLNTLPGDDYDDLTLWLHANFDLTDPVGIDLSLDDATILVFAGDGEPAREFPLGELELPAPLQALRAMQRAGGIANMEPPELRPTA